jgi:spore maturation protein CgeB
MNLNIVVIGLSVTSSWGNGHATTYRALIEALAQRGHQITFLERDVAWYRNHRDLVKPSGWNVGLYESLSDIPHRFGQLIRGADLVIIGSFVPDGIAISEWVTSQAHGITAFYDIDTPVTLSRLEGGLDYLSAAMIPRFDLYLSFSGGPVPQMIEESYGSPLARTLYCSADTALYAPQQAELKWSLGYLGTYSDDRQPILEQLLLVPANTIPSGQFVVAGAQYPEHIIWPGNVSRIEHLTPQQHPMFYSQQRFALNATRADLRALGSLRAFGCLKRPLAAPRSSRTNGPESRRSSSRQTKFFLSQTRRMSSRSCETCLRNVAARSRRTRENEFSPTTHRIIEPSNWRLTIWRHPRGVAAKQENCRKSGRCRSPSCKGRIP